MMKKGTGFAILLWVAAALAAPPLGAEEKVLVQDGSVRYKMYTVKRGDSIWKIAEKELQNAGRWNEILVPEKMNFVSRTPDLIRPGQVVILPFKDDSYLAEGEDVFAGDGQAAAGGGAAAAGGEADGQAAELSVGSIGVVPFKNESRSAELKWVGAGLAETMTQELEKIRSVKVVKTYRPDSPGANVDAVLTGSVNAAGTDVQIRTTLTSAKDRQVLSESRISGTLDHLIDLARISLIKVLDGIVDLPGDVQAEILAGKKTSLGAMENLGKARLLGEQGKSKQAKDLYRKALVSDPTNSAALERLKENISTADALAVLPLTNVAGKLEHNWLGQGIAEALTTDLKKLTGVNLVERMQVEKTLEELKLSAIGGLVDEKTVPKVGKMTGAAIVLIGSFQTDNQQIRMDIRMVDVASGIVLLTETAGGLFSKLFEVESVLAEKIAATLNVQLTPEQKQKMLAERPDLESFKQHILATSSLHIEKKESKSSRVRSIAVLQFENSSKTAEFDWLRSALPGGLTTDITTEARIPLVERMQIDRALEELKLASVGVISADSAPKIGHLVGADALITGSFQVVGEDIRIDSSVIKVETGEVLGSARVSGRTRNVLGLQRKLADEILVALGVRKPAQVKDLKPSSESWSKIVKYDGETERHIKTKRVYRFEASSDNKERLKDTLENLRYLSADEALTELNQWIPTVRGERNAQSSALLVKEGDKSPFPGFLLPREHLDRVLFLKDEMDMCLQHWDRQISAKQK